MREANSKSLDIYLRGQKKKKKANKKTPKKVVGKVLKMAAGFKGKHSYGGNKAQYEDQLKG